MILKTSHSSLASKKHGSFCEHHVALHYLYKTSRCLTLLKQQAVKIRKSPELVICAPVLERRHRFPSHMAAVSFLRYSVPSRVFWYPTRLIRVTPTFARFSSSAASTPSDHSLPDKWESYRKKKVVIRIGYVGTDYRGLQIQRDDPSLKSKFPIIKFQPLSLKLSLNPQFLY